jgi:hypothetical protein
VFDAHRRDNDPVITKGLADFVARDWDAVRRAKDQYWAQRIAHLGPAEGFRIAEELRLQALMHNPSWPTSEQRREDLAAHVRLAGLFSHADSTGGR